LYNQYVASRHGLALLVTRLYVIIMDNQVSLETTGYPSLSRIADALTDPLPLPRWIICQTAQFGMFLLILAQFLMSGLPTTILIPHRIFGHTAWELPHNTQNIAHFGILHNINYSHTLPTSLQLYHCTIIGPPMYLSSSSVYICIT
jgi:hypothetical protein